MAKHKKNMFCSSELHEFVNNQCVNCGDYQDYLFAPESWFRGYFITSGKPKKSHKA